MNYAQNLKKLREIKGLNQKDIADILKIKQQQYSLIEREIRELHIDQLITLCKFYNISADYILGLNNTPKTYKNN